MSSVKQSPWVSLLAVAAAVLTIAAYFTPLWWVSLTAPNYPPDAFPDGIRIMFGFQGVTNGCTSAPKASRISQETLQEDLGWRSEEGGHAAEAKGEKADVVLDCLHEMNTINHYVGMHPIGVGAPVETVLAPYILGLFAVALLGFAVGPQKARVVVLGVGFAGVAGWMVVNLWGRGLLKAHVTQYMDDAGKYFREAERIAGWGDTLTTVVTGIAVVLVVLMALIVAASARWPRFQLVLGVVPALLPGFFIGSLAGWLWFFGHNLHPWGAFTVKPFMPTVFGDGKVAQFSTHSYPTTAFGILVAITVLLLLAVLRRRLEYLDAEPPAPAPHGAVPAASGGKA